MASGRHKFWRYLLGGALVSPALMALALWAVFSWADARFPPVLPHTIEHSASVVDRHGALLRPFTTAEGRWRFAVKLSDVDPTYLKLLINYEDKRFYSHHGVDWLALIRAAGQFAANGEIVSGGSTLTMQLARLLEPAQRGTMKYKLNQIFRALQLERRLSKQQILEAYLTLAPYGGNLEGLRSASLAWFGSEPITMNLEQAALLVALPQSPESRRPDRYPRRARAARNRVLDRAVGAGLIAPEELTRVAHWPVPDTKRPMPQFAAHVAARVQHPARRKVTTSLVRPLQAAAEARLRFWAGKVAQGSTVAAMIINAKDGSVLASIGSARHLLDSSRGWLDMTHAVRSPGSTLKPFIYAMAFADGIAAPATLIWDRPIDFQGYRPQNFDAGYQGQVSIREALQRSLNVPAVQLLERIGPYRLMAAMQRAGVAPKLPSGARASLSIGLGGLGLRLTDLVQLYAAFAAEGSVRPISIEWPPDVSSTGYQLLPQPATATTASILAAIAPPPQAPRLRIGYKTGTSYGYRDAWAVGFDGQHVIGVWVGRPDNGAVPGATGYGTAAPILFDLFNMPTLALTPLSAIDEAAAMPLAELPPSLRRFTAPGQLVQVNQDIQRAPQIVHPPNGADLQIVGDTRSGFQPLAIKIQGGLPPFRLLLNGRPMPGKQRRRTTFFTPDGPGFNTLTVVDRLGATSSVQISLVDE